MIEAELINIHLLEADIMQTPLCYLYPRALHFYIIKLYLGNRFEPPQSCFIALTVLRRWFLVLFLLNNFGVGVSCRILYAFVVYLYVSRSGSITSVGEERANLCAFVYL